MLQIPLNNTVLQNHKLLAVPVNIIYRRQYERNKYRWAECVFLTQCGNKLTYTTCTPRHVIQSYDMVNFELPHPLTINLRSVPYKPADKSAILEVPDCTLETLNTFYNPNRPKYIKTDDLQTKIISINGRRANLEYINPQKFLDQLADMNFKAYPVLDHTEYQWFKQYDNGEIDYCDISNIYKIVTGQDFQDGRLRHQGNNAIISKINQLHRAASKHAILTKEFCNGTEYNLYHMPIAIFETPKQKVIWMGQAQKIK